MFEVRGGSLIDVMTTTEWDSNANNYAGANKVVVQLELDPSVQQMLIDFTNLQADIKAIIERDKAEEQLRKDWPALQDVYSQYQMVKHMLEDAKKPKEEDASNS